MQLKMSALEDELDKRACEADQTVAYPAFGAPQTQDRSLSAYSAATVGGPDGGLDGNLDGGPLLVSSHPWSPLRDRDDLCQQSLSLLQNWNTLHDSTPRVQGVHSAAYFTLHDTLY